MGVKREYSDIEDLPRVGPSTATKLRNMGFHTVESVAMATVEELVEAGIPEKTARMIIDEARKVIRVEFLQASELLKLRENIRKLTTGSRALDELVGGGLETSTITELFGEFGTGKSQICHQLCVNVQLSYEEGGLEGGALYIDTENSFRPNRIVDMAKYRGLDPDKVLENILVAPAYNSDHQMLLLEKADEIIKKNNIKLVIIDSVMSHFRSEYLGRELLARRQQKLNKHLHRLERLATVFNAVAVVTNQVMSRPNDFFSMGAYPVGGHIIAHRSHTRIFIRKAHGKPGLRIARLVVSLDRPEGECVFRITNEGVIDEEEV
ncbi:DNA repair and recombination protein RadA [Candidatus Bathyarchaeota archaeon ex4484_205]|nr:MAG: DNA repair and recombination protein RadA [Candidatus Bathyarchaeota archaeon ex4484_205]RLG67431.1 MAG: DNA repair and recombination protein RadA [archaeon]